MYAGMGAIQFMGMLMSQSSVEISVILELVEILNNSYFECQRVVTILTDIFQREKSGKILLAVNILQYLVKNANKNFHQAANKESFQKRIIGLLKRVRGKSSFLKDLRSNSDNWNKIEAKVLYLIQLWYDAFILEESVYNNIIDSYKTLRKENIIFPPRSVNEKNLLAVKTQSPIFQNIEDISRRDHQKFGRKLQNLGMKRAQRKMEMIEEAEHKKKLTRKVDINDISERIAIVRSNGCQGKDMLLLIEEIKKDLEYGLVDSSEQMYWKDIKQAAESIILEWEQTNAELIKQFERQFLEAKLGKMSMKQEKGEEPDFNSQKEEEHPRAQEVPAKIETKTQEINLLDL